MPLVQFKWPTGPLNLFEMGVERLKKFCTVNQIPEPDVTAVKGFQFDTCAYYRPKEGIKICLAKCGRPCTEETSRNWTWPASVTDREPYGVIAHELGHHCDWLKSNRKGRYYGDYGERMEKESKEPPITSYCPNSAEWFAEIFRVFVTNPHLLSFLRPKTYGILLRTWKPVGAMDWKHSLGTNVPPKILRTLTNKGAR